MKLLVALLLLNVLWVTVTSFILKECATGMNESYAIGDCEPIFLMCFEGSASLMNCPPGLVYNEKEKICDWELNVAGCGEIDGVSVDNVFGTGNTTNGFISALLSDDKNFVNVCANLENGTFSFGGCTKNFFNCTSKSARFLKCAEPSYYNPIKNECSNKELIEECIGKEESAVVKKNVERFRRNSAKSRIGKITSDCKNLPDGTYPLHQCSSQFLTCAGSQAGVMKCLGTLVFDPSSLTCKPSSNVSKCSGLVPTNPLCEQDGYFSISPCSSSYIICHNGSATNALCENGLMFSEKTRMCNYESIVQECQSLETTTLPTVKSCSTNELFKYVMSEYEKGYRMRLNGVSVDCFEELVYRTAHMFNKLRLEKETKETALCIVGIVCFILSIALGCMLMIHFKVCE